MVLSRRGEKLLRDGEFRRYAQSTNFPKTLIHPSIADNVWLDLARGDLETAVFKAFRAVEIAVRSAGGYAETEIGPRWCEKLLIVRPDRSATWVSRSPNVKRWRICSLVRSAL